MAGSATIAGIFAQRVVIGVGDLAVSNNPSVILSTYALGSCIGVVAYDPVARAGGILHLMLPDSNIAPHSAATKPAMFADTGLPLLLRGLMGLKAERSRLRVFLAGGASVLTGHDSFKIGERNLRVTLDLLAQNGLNLREREVGGTTNRTVHLAVASGALTLKMPGSERQTSLA